MEDSQVQERFSDFFGAYDGPILGGFYLDFILILSDPNFGWIT